LFSSKIIKTENEFNQFKGNTPNKIITAGTGYIKGNGKGAGVFRENPLKEIVRQEIMTAGVPMSLARFMELGLMHPEHGYYSTKDKIFNKGGDFTTSPEISQMFGEMLGIWLMTTVRNNYIPAEL
jgi:hypothetical protein